MEKKNVSKTTTEQTTIKKKEIEIVEETFEDFGFEKDDSTGGYDEVYFVRPVTKNAAYFEFSKKVGETLHKDLRTTIQILEGKLLKVELGSYVYEGRDVKFFKLHIVKTVKDKEVLFIMSSSFTQCGRSIINSILGCNQPIDKIHITLYVNYSGYTSVKMSINTKRAEWKYSIAEQKPMIASFVIDKKGTTKPDYSELDEFLQDQLQNHLSVILPNEEHRRIIPEVSAESVFTEESPENDEATFGENEEADFFELGEE